MGSYTAYMFLVGYIVFMTFMLGQVDQYNIETDIGNTKIEGAESYGIVDYLSLFWKILTFNVTSGTEVLPLWFNLLIAVPIYALILYFIVDLIGNTINPLG